jgi:hypothetical protein
MNELRLRQEYTQVLVIDCTTGKAIMDLPFQAAILLGRGLIELGKKAEQAAAADGVVFDQAFALRVGLPFGFSTDPKIKDEARKEAGHNRELRKMIPHTRDDRRGDVEPPVMVGSNGEQINR